MSDRAVDGNTDPSVMSGSCSHTDTDAKNKSASWSVNLEGLYYLSWINITNSTWLLSFSIIVPTFYGASCQLSLPSVHFIMFMAA